MAVAALAAIVVLTDTPDATRGRELYLAVTLFGFGYAMLAGVLLTADAINEERSRGTLGLLFLTDLRWPDILLGKLAATSLKGVYVLVGLLPLLAVPLMFGGITPLQVAGHALLLVGTLALSLCVGLSVSASSRETGTAIAKGFGQMAALAVLPGFLMVFPSRITAHLAMASPVASFAMLFNPAELTRRPSLLAAGLIFPWVLAALVFRRTLSRLIRSESAPDDQPEKPRPSVLSRPIFSRQSDPDLPPVVAHGAWGRGSPPPEGLLESDPILWLLWRQNRFPRADKAMIGVLSVVAVPTLLASLAGPLGWFCVAFMAFLLHLLAVCHMASQACQRIRTLEEREALELLLTTPRAAKGTLRSYHRGFCQLFTPQFAALLTVHAMLLLGALVGGEDLPRRFWLVPAVALAVLFAEREALSWVSLNLSLRHGRYHRALLGTVVLVVLPSWGAVAVALFGNGLLAGMGSSGVVIWLVWLLAGCAWPGCLAAVSRARAAHWLQNHGAASPSESHA